MDTSTTTPTFITKWGQYGIDNGQFISPIGVDVDSAGNVYVAEGYNRRIQKFTSEGAFITKWGEQGSGDGQFGYPFDVAVDAQGNVYVTDTDNHCVLKFDANANFLTKWGEWGYGDGQFRIPRGVDTDQQGNVKSILQNRRKPDQLMLSAAVFTQGVTGNCQGRATGTGSDLYTHEQVVELLLPIDG